AASGPRLLRSARADTARAAEAQAPRRVRGAARMPRAAERSGAVAPRTAAHAGDAAYTNTTRPDLPPPTSRDRAATTPSATRTCCFPAESAPAHTKPRPGEPRAGRRPRARNACGSGGRL